MLNVRRSTAEEIWVCNFGVIAPIKNDGESATVPSVTPGYSLILHLAELGLSNAQHLHSITICDISSDREAVCLAKPKPFSADG
jgi:hypothetical protein